MKTILLILLALIMSTTTLKAEKLTGQAKLDSLLSELPKAKGDTNEVKLLNNISYNYNSINPNKGIEYGEQGLKLANKLDWEKGEAYSFNSLGVNYQNLSDYPKASEYYGKALKIYEELGNKNGIATNLGNMGNIYANQSDFPKALEYYQKALKINEESGYKKGVANNLGNIGGVFADQFNYSRALEYYSKALKIDEEIGNKNGIANNLVSIGTVFLAQSNYSRALEYYFKALKINEEIGNKMQIAKTHSNIGVIYVYQNNYNNALEYFFKALKINEDIGNKMEVAYNLNNIGAVYKKQSNNPKALKYFKKVLDGFNEIQNQYIVTAALANIGVIYESQSDYPKALKYFNKALDKFKETRNQAGIASTLGNIGSVYLMLSQDSVKINQNEINQYVSLNKRINLNRSLQYFHEAIILYKEIGELSIRSHELKMLAKAYRLKEDYKNADKYYQEHIKLKDSVFNQENNKQIAALEKAREDDVNRIKIEKQEVQLAAQESEKMFIIYSGIGIIAFVIAILALIAYQRKKSDKLLYNVLPISIAKRLKKKEHPISDHFAQASIIFIDIVGFTAMSKDSDPTDIVQALNKVFTHYDSIASKHGLEKIKTIGDCYMAAAGIPVIQKDNTLRAARMAIEVRDYMVDYYTDHGFKLDVRIGLDCGPVVAGVIGDNKFIYDMWSDAVNTASRMESTGQSGSVQISERFKEAVFEFDEFEFEARGEMEIKGKGKMKTFFMGSRIPTSL